MMIVHYLDYLVTNIVFAKVTITSIQIRFILKYIIYQNIFFWLVIIVYPTNISWAKLVKVSYTCPLICCLLDVPIFYILLSKENWRILYIWAKIRNYWWLSNNIITVSSNKIVLTKVIYTIARQILLIRTNT